MAQKILVVDDEPLGRRNLHTLLNAEGYDVREAASGEEAMEMLPDERFDLVITDFVMPHGHGLQLVDVLHTLYPRLPVVLLTAYLSVSAGSKIVSGKAEVLQKPFQFDELLSTVRRLLHVTTVYRKVADSQTWHFCSNCTHWPKDDYEESTLPVSGDACNQCKALHHEGNCRT